LRHIDGHEGAAVPDAVGGAAQNFRRQFEEVAADDLKPAVGILKINYECIE